jgi:hypothetical protein
MSIIFNQTDVGAVCGPTVACSPNGLGANAVGGRQANVQAQYGSQEVTVTMAASETAKIYAYFEIVPAARVTWSAGDVLLNFHITTPNGNVDWVRTDVCHLNAACTSLETLATDTVPVNLGPSERDFVLKLIPGLISAVVPITTSDKVMILLSFTNAVASVQSFGWTPNLDITLPWLDRGIEIVAHMGKSKKKVPRDILGNPIARPEEEVLLMLGDEEPFG